MTRIGVAAGLFLLLSVGAGVCQSVAGVAIVQPGAPGQESHALTPGAARTPLHQPTAADAKFMQDMIMHHGQAVEMTALIAARTTNPALVEIGKKISISQTDERRYMQQWLEERSLPVAMAGGMAGMDPNMDMGGMSMDDMPMMVGMLSPHQMRDLAAAKGTKFDHLFLTGMIQHHTGALTMVDGLFNTAGAGQDPQLFDFATDVENTQKAEIRIMQGLLAKEDAIHKEKS